MIVSNRTIILLLYNLLLSKHSQCALMYIPSTQRTAPETIGSTLLTRTCDKRLHYFSRQGQSAPLILRALTTKASTFCNRLH